MHNRLTFLLILSILCLACDDRKVFSQYKPIQNSTWNREDTLRFKFSGLDPEQTYNIFINLRHDESFPFSNLFLITEMENPYGKIQKDTLEYTMAKPTGEWLGRGLGSIRENKLWFREKITFPDSGVYQVNMIHAMRKNGTLKGMQTLNGITDVGLEIQKSIP